MLDSHRNSAAGGKFSYDKIQQVGVPNFRSCLITFIVFRHDSGSTSRVVMVFLFAPILGNRDKTESFFLCDIVSLLRG